MLTVDKIKSFISFFFTDTKTSQIYTLSLHDALPISDGQRVTDYFRCADLRHAGAGHRPRRAQRRKQGIRSGARDRKSTRLNSSHQIISYAVFCLKKKNHILLSQSFDLNMYTYARSQS